MPIIFREVLQGLQETSAQNVRVRINPSDFCEALAQLGDYPVTSLPDKRVELALGDLVSEEERVLVLQANVLPIPLIDGRPAASLSETLQVARNLRLRTPTWGRQGLYQSAECILRVAKALN